MSYRFADEDEDENFDPRFDYEEIEDENLSSIEYEEKDS